MNKLRLWNVLALGLMCCAPAAARAHFAWIVPDEKEPQRLHVYFGESALPDDPALLKNLQGMEVWKATAAGFEKLSLDLGDESWIANINPQDANCLYVLRHDYGVIERGGQSFLLRYYAKTGPAASAAAWKQIECGKQLELDLVPSVQDGRVNVTVLWQGQPASGDEVVVSGPGIEELKENTDEDGRVSFDVAEAGLFSIRARHIEERSGDLEGKKFGSVRHYCTLALNAGADKPSEEASLAVPAFPDIPVAVTSFAAAIADGALYIYGGHTGSAHSYSNAEQGDTLYRLNLENPTEWQKVVTGPPLQGLSMVAVGSKLYRLGGFTAKNAAGQDHDLWSQADVASFDPATGNWTELPSLPEPRSSFDAAVVDGKIYVVGGWQLQGSEESHWHETAYVLDPAAAEPAWSALPSPPFQRRALALAEHAGKLYAVGGMQQEGGPTTRVDVFDPATGRWEQGPSLNGEPMEGFGASAFATNGRLYASTMKGNLQRLSDDGKSWETLRQLERARFFHRMLPLAPGQLLMIGGANMGEGKFTELDVIDVQ